MSRCTSCHRHITWVKMPSGKRMPLDPDPTADGNIRIPEPNRYLPDGARFGEPVDKTNLTHVTGITYTSHFATCDFADEHRKKKP